MTKLMKLSGLMLLAAVAAGAQGLRESGTTRELTGMLRQFLVDAGSGNRAGFDKFFADDLIYTRAAGVVITKADIMKSLEDPKPTEENKTTYSAEDITVHEYGDTAVVAFQLVARTEHKEGKVETDHYRNTGTFLRRDGRWQVVAWQATKIPEAEKKQ
jgi:ketosteroid isomerase-like protein